MASADPCRSHSIPPSDSADCLKQGADPFLDDGIDLFIWGNAESCVTIVAASIPILRVLFRDVKASSRRYYLSGEGETGSSAVRRTTKRGSASAGARNDDGSEKSILDGSSQDKSIRGGQVVEFQDWKDIQNSRSTG